MRNAPEGHARIGEILPDSLAGVTPHSEESSTPSIGG